MFRRAASILLIFVVAACGQKPDPQPDCNFVQNNDLQRVSWKESTPVVIYLHQSVPSQFRASIFAAMAQWDYLLGRQIFKVGGIVGGSGEPKKDGISVIYFMNSWEEDRALEQARTTIYWEGAQIREADLRINARDFTYSASMEPPAGTVDLESLLVHELGHALGLKHNEESGSVMNTHLPYATNRREPQVMDESSLRCEY